MTKKTVKEDEKSSTEAKESETIETKQPKLSDMPGVGPVSIKKLNNAGITSIYDLIVRGPMEIARITGKDKDDADVLVEKARELLSQEGLITKAFISGTQLLEERSKVGIISTGTKALDKLMVSDIQRQDGKTIGGVETKSITEVFGEFGSGKTQLCHTLAVMVQKPKSEGGLDGNVLWIDTENTFRPERIITICNAKNPYPDTTKKCEEHGTIECEECKALNMDPMKVLERITCARAFNSSTQKLMLEDAAKYIRENNIKLIIVDSGIGLFRSEYHGTGELARRQQGINAFVYLLQRTAETYDCAAIMTNQVQATPMAFGDPIKPIGGNIVGHTSTYRIYLKKAGKKHIAKMIDSPHHEQSEVQYALTAAGVADVED